MVITLMLLIGSPAIYAKGGAYQSGFSHGVSDGNDSCRHSDGCHWYILEPGKGFAFHSKEFVRGYVNGFCSVDPNTSSDSDHASFDCSQASQGQEGDLEPIPKLSSCK